MGVPHPEFLGRILDAQQMAEWEAYFRCEPHGEERADWHAAQICSILAEVNRDRDKKHDAYTIHDFKLDFFKEDGPEQSMEDMKSIMMSMVRGK